MSLLDTPNNILLEDAINDLNNVIDKTTALFVSDNNSINIILNNTILTDMLNFNTNSYLYLTNYTSANFDFYNNYISVDNYISPQYPPDLPTSNQTISDHTDQISQDGTIVFFQSYDNYKQDNYFKHYLYNHLNNTYDVSYLLFDYNKNNNNKYLIANNNIKLSDQLNITDINNQIDLQYDSTYPIINYIDNQCYPDQLLPKIVSYTPTYPNTSLYNISKYLNFNIVIPESSTILIDNVQGIEQGIKYIFNSPQQINKLDSILIQYQDTNEAYNLHEKTTYNQNVIIKTHNPIIMLNGGNSMGTLTMINIYGLVADTNLQELMGTYETADQSKFYINIDDKLILTPKKIKELKMVVTHKSLQPVGGVRGINLPYNDIPNKFIFNQIPLPGICAKFVPSYDTSKLNNNKYAYINYFQSKEFIKFKPIYCKIKNIKQTTKNTYNNINKNNQFLKNITYLPNNTNNTTILKADYNNNITSPYFELNSNPDLDCTVNLITFDLHNVDNMNDATVLYSKTFSSTTIDMTIPFIITDDIYINIILNKSNNLNKILKNISKYNYNFISTNNYENNFNLHQENILNTSNIKIVDIFKFDESSTISKTIISNGLTNNLYIHRKTNNIRLTSNNNMLNRKFICKLLQIKNDNIINTFYYNTDVTTSQQEIEQINTVNILDIATELQCNSSKEIFNLDLTNLDSTECDYLVLYISPTDYNYKDSAYINDIDYIKIFHISYTINFASEHYENININTLKTLINNNDVLQYNIYYT